MKQFYLPVLFICLLCVLSCGPNENGSDNGEKVITTPSISYTVVGTHAHDTSSFTEGFEFYNGAVLESTGLEGRSKLLLYNLENGEVKNQLSLDPKFFGEGVTVFRDTAYQLTYRESTVLVYDVRSFKKIKELPLSGEGWGLTHDSSYLIASNGSNNLYYYEPGTMRQVKKLAVEENGVPAVNLNELEYINGFIYANQWQMNYILKIDPSTGNVVGKMDLTGIAQEEKLRNSYAEFLNGIAYNRATNKTYITGKYWSKIYQLQFAF